MLSAPRQIGRKKIVPTNINKEMVLGKGLEQPSELTIGPDGTLYFLNRANATVMSYKRGEGTKVAYNGTYEIGHIKIYDANKVHLS